MNNVLKCKYCTEDNICMNFDDCKYQVSGVFDTMDFCGAVSNEDEDKGESEEA